MQEYGTLPLKYSMSVTCSFDGVIAAKASSIANASAKKSGGCPAQAQKVQGQLVLLYKNNNVIILNFFQ